MMNATSLTFFLPVVARKKHTVDSSAANRPIRACCCCCCLVPRRTSALGQCSRDGNRAGSTSSTMWAMAAVICSCRFFRRHCKSSRIVRIGIEANRFRRQHRRNCSFFSESRPELEGCTPEDRFRLRVDLDCDAPSLTVGYGTQQRSKSKPKTVRSQIDAIGPKPRSATLCCHSP